AVSADFLVCYRHSPVDFAGEDGYGLEDTLKFAPELEKAGLNVIDISPSTVPESGPHVNMAAAAKEVTRVPVIAVGGMNNPKVAEDTLSEDKAHLVAVGRGLIADAQWSNKVREGREAEIIECIECNEKCYGNLGQGIPISCTQNPRSGFEFEE
nr:hypothetical protein [Armatimonadota bacterium]NIM23808.1 hypothetical protein [Armatimonadota bacterium]NIM67687.1 hypothetical protein [Armatimonadota bacterium]NIM76197.1 hypothetical protein [Armatimonadota bacterium]NIN05889.1 hypothetical protein [Armatimonadota bacterium]